MLKRTLICLTAALAASSLAACGDDSTSSASDPAASSGSSAAASSGSSTCSYPSDPAGAAKKVDAPPATPTVSGQVKATITSTVGDLKLTLDADSAPCTVNSFVSLAKQGFYDNTPCHRMADDPGFAFLQCGDPTGTGKGGPGYFVPDEFDGSEKYPAGTLAMANTGQPNTGGSQFFMVFGDTKLPPQYTVFGKLDAASITTLKKVGKAGVTHVDPSVGGGTPKKKVTFEKVTIA